MIRMIFLIDQIRITQHLVVYSIMVFPCSIGGKGNKSINYTK